MAQNVAKRTLSPARQRLVELMQRLHFGQILELWVEDGEPLFDPVPRVIRDIKFASETEARLDPARANFLLKQQVVELFRYFDQLQDGVIDSIEVKHGLPFRLQHAEPLV